MKFKGFAQLERMYEYAMRMVVEDESDIAFLYRDGAMAMPLVELFMQHQVPFHLHGSVKKFLQEPVVKDLCNIIELLIDPKDMRAFYEVYELPERKSWLLPWKISEPHPHWKHTR